MTPRERVLTTLARQKPDKVPKEAGFSRHYMKYLNKRPIQLNLMNISIWKRDIHFLKILHEN